MSKVNFKQPKFIIPLILLPFIFLSFYLWNTFKSKGDKAKLTTQDSLALVKAKGLNTDMPKVSTDVSGAEVKDKFGAYSEAYKNQKIIQPLILLKPSHRQTEKQRAILTIRLRMYSASWPTSGWTV